MVAHVVVHELLATQKYQSLSVFGDFHYDIVLSVLSLILYTPWISSNDNAHRHKPHFIFYDSLLPMKRFQQ